MTTFTGTELATRVLKDLGLIAAEETPSSTDLVWSQETCDSEIALMSAKGIPVWNGSQEYLTTLSRRIGLAIAPSFGLTDVATATVAMTALEKDLRIMAQTGPTGEIQQSEYF